MDSSRTDPAAGTLAAAVPVTSEQPLPGLRAWFAAYLLWLGGLAGVALLMFARYEDGEAGALRLWLLALTGFYLSLCNITLPLPTTWIILLAAGAAGGAFPAGWLWAGGVAVLGALATVAANLNEYHLLSVLLRYGLGRRIRRSHVYLWAIRWFDAAPFQTLAFAGFVPIPIDAIRWLAILRRYSRLRFALAYFVGRAARYAILAWFSVLVQLTPWQVVAIQAGLIGAALAGRLLWRATARRGRNGGAGDATGANGPAP